MKKIWLRYLHLKCELCDIKHIVCTLSKKGIFGVIANPETLFVSSV